jgi:hypothetical protein
MRIYLSQADASKTIAALGYESQCKILQGNAKAMPWYIEFIGSK